MIDNKKCSVIIVASGNGSRMNTKTLKQFIKLKEKPILAYTIEEFNNNINVDEIIVVTKKDYIKYCKDEIVEKYNYKKVKNIIIGGKERQDSVYEGLKILKNTYYVMIHDGVRPFVQQKDINNLVKNIKKYNSCILGVKAKDTIKMCNNNLVDKTLDRDKIWLIQTPQCFKYEVLIKAYKKAKENNYIKTDDASLLEYIKEELYITEGSYFNIKITTKEDLYYAKFLIENIKFKENI